MPMLNGFAPALAGAARATPTGRGRRRGQPRSTTGVLAGLPLVLPIVAGLAAGPAAADEDDASPACANIYDRQACSCAARAIAGLAPARPADTVLADAAGATPMVPRPVQLPRRDLAELLQSCMAPGAQTPAD